MNQLRRPQWVAVIILALPCMVRAEDTRDTLVSPPLLSHDQLQKRLADTSLRLVDVRSEADYKKGHIPGAVWLNTKIFEALTRDDAITDTSAWSKALAPLGVGSDTEVYVYDGERQHFAASRAWFLISYVSGTRKVGLVDGTYPAWERAKRPTSVEVPSILAHDYQVSFNPQAIATHTEVNAASLLGTSQLVDARSLAEYLGSGLCPISGKPLPNGKSGHIPSARLLESSTLVDENGQFVETAALRTLLQKAGLKENIPTIVYAQGGARSSVVVFALRRLGVPVRHYQKGLIDWAANPTRPFVKGAELKTVDTAETSGKLSIH